MSYYNNASSDYLMDVARNRIATESFVHKFGASATVGTTFQAISNGNVYQTPQVAGATALRVKAGGSTADTSDGAGAQKVYLQGLDETGALVSEEVTTAGASASSATTTTFMRLFRAWVSESGTYALTSAGSHTSAITIEDGAGSADWLTISATDYPRGQSLVSWYTVPLGKTAYFHSALISADSTKAADVIFLKRDNILETAAPYSAMRLVEEWVGIAAPFSFNPDSPIKFDALTDVGFMGKVGTGTGSVSIDFELLLVDD